MGWKYMQQVIVAASGKLGVYPPNARSHAPMRADCYYIWKQASIVDKEYLYRNNSFMWLQKQKVSLKLAKQQHPPVTEGDDIHNDIPDDPQDGDYKEGDDEKTNIAPVRAANVWKGVHFLQDAVYYVQPKDRLKWDPVYPRTYQHPPSCNHYDHHTIPIGELT
jgi:hypothetical protein